MERRGRIRMSTMEIVLVATLLGSLLLSLLQAMLSERLQHEAQAANEHQ